EAADRREVGDGVGEDDLAAHGEPGGYAGHVLLRHAGVDEPVGEALAEPLEDRVTEVAGEEPHALVPRGELHQRLDEGPSHSVAPISPSARASWAASGAL